MAPSASVPPSLATAAVIPRDERRFTLRSDAGGGGARQAGSMNPSRHVSHSTSLTPAGVVIRIALRALGLVAVVAALSTFSPTTDPVGAGLELFFWTAMVAFGVAFVDGWRRPLTESLLVWAGTAVVATGLEAVYLALPIQPRRPWTWGTFVEDLASQSDFFAQGFLFAVIAAPAATGVALGWASRQDGRPRRPGWSDSAAGGRG